MRNTAEVLLFPTLRAKLISYGITDGNDGTPWHACVGTEGWWMYGANPFVNSLLEGSGWAGPRPDRFAPCRENRWPLYSRLVGSLGSCGHVWKISPPPRDSMPGLSRPQTVAAWCKSVLWQVNQCTFYKKSFSACPTDYTISFHKLQYEPDARCLYLLYNATTCFGHFQWVTGLAYVCSVSGKCRRCLAEFIHV